MTALPNSAGYDFRRCKLCGRRSAEPTYHLGAETIHVCSACDFHYLDYLDGSALTRASRSLSDRERDYLTRRRDEGLAEHYARLELASQHLSFEGSKVLDIGAGLGLFQSMLEPLGADVEGIEASPLRRRYAQDTLGRTLSAELIDSSARQSTQRNSFDLITLWDVIEHVDFPKETLDMAIRLLKPGGLLFLDTPSREDPAYRLSERLYRLSGGRISLFLPSFYSNAPFGHKQIFTRRQLLDLFTDLGVEVVHQGRGYPGERRRKPRIILGVRRCA